MDSGQYEFGAYRLDVHGRILFREGGMWRALFCKPPIRREIPGIDEQSRLAWRTG